MRRIVNFRAFLIIAAAVAFAAIFAFLSFINRLLGWILFIALVAFSVTLVFVSFSRGRKKYICVTFIISALLSVEAFFNFIITVGSWNRETIIESENYSVSGTVDDVYDSDGRTVIILRNVSIIGQKHAGKIRIYAPDEIRLSEIDVGDTVYVESIRLYRNNLIENGKVNAYYKRTNIRYNANAFAGDVEFVHGKKNFLDIVSGGIHSLFATNMGSGYGAVAYAMLTGDKSGISYETYSAYNISGIAHVLAVSGLHVGFVAAIISFLMKKLKAGRVPTFVTVTAFLLFYTFLADFSSSVVRASIMTQTALAASVFGNRKDKLSALSFAVTVILAVSPLYLFEAGFQLSVGAVLGMILFSDTLSKALCKIKFPKLLASALSTSVSVQIGILPSLIYNFGEIQVYALLSNVLIIPLISVTFAIVFVFMIISAILPFMGFLLKFSSLGFRLTDICATGISLLPYAVVPLRSTALIFLAYPAYFVISRFFMLGRAKLPVKIPIVLLCGVLLAHGAFVLPPYRMDNAVIPVYGTDYTVSIVRSDGKTYIVGDLYSYYPVWEMLNKFRIDKIDEVYLTDLNAKSAQAVVKIGREFKCGAFYSPQGESIDGLVSLADSGIDNYYLLTPFDELQTDIECVYQAGEFICYRMPFGEKCVLFFGQGKSYETADYSLINTAAVIRTFEFTGEFADRIFIVNSSFGGLASPPLGLSALDSPDTVFDFVNGTFLALP